RPGLQRERRPEVGAPAAAQPVLDVPALADPREDLGAFAHEGIGVGEVGAELVARLARAPERRRRGLCCLLHCRSPCVGMSTLAGFRYEFNRETRLSPAALRHTRRALCIA